MVYLVVAAGVEVYLDVVLVLMVYLVVAAGVDGLFFCSCWC